MKSGPTVLLVGSVTLGLTAALFTMAIRHHGSQQVTYAASDPAAQAELERLLRKHDVAFAYTGAQTPLTTGNVTLTASLQGIVIDNAGAPNAVAAMKEYSGWLESKSSATKDATGSK